MIINRLTYLQQQIIFAMLPMLFLFLTHTISFGQIKNNDNPYCTNIKWSASEELVTISYDLVGNPQTKYNVKIVMKQESDPNFSFVPTLAEGDIGDGYFAGSSKQILWYFQTEFPQGLSLEGGYYFEIQVRPAERQYKWVYYAIGAVAVTGGMIALISGHKQNSSPSASELPGPPGRP